MGWGFDYYLLVRSNPHIPVRCMRLGHIQRRELGYFEKAG
jgi:hypothetical protein